jgi:hypothetical protein
MNKEFIINSVLSACGNGCNEIDMISIIKDEKNDIIINIVENDIDSYCRYHNYHNKKEITLKLDKTHKDDFINYLKKTINELEK